jgi:hypothetical protein
MEKTSLPRGIETPPAEKRKNRHMLRTGVINDCADANATKLDYSIQKWLVKSEGLQPDRMEIPYMSPVKNLF